MPIAGWVLNRAIHHKEFCKSLLAKAYERPEVLHRMNWANSFIVKAQNAGNDRAVLEISDKDRALLEQNQSFRT